MLWGDYGVGKTWLAAATLNALSQLREFALYLRMSQLMQTLRDSWKGDERTGQLLEYYCQVPILFIDDMSDSSQDVMPLPAYQQDYAAAIMRARMGDRRPTLVTSNWERERFAMKWGRVCAEVMLEGLDWIEVGGERLRNVSSVREETL
jgi:DNA replication protein DnaC